MSLALAQSGAPRFTALPPLSLYVHIPWCIRKCPYCDFNSHALRGALPESQYVQALIADLEQAEPLIRGRKVHTVFFGGGTPSLLSAEAFDEILNAIRARLPLLGGAEVTVEANPGTFEVARFRAYRALGINRLSIGVQSFNSRHLKALGRVHDDIEARRAIEIARAHFANVNLDLMYALPGQTLAEALADIKTAIAYHPQHISAYSLTLEPNTLFYRDPPPLLPDDDLSAAMQCEIETTLAAVGYDHYETSSFALEGFRSRHNLNYWEFGDYLGIGAGAHSKLSFRDRIIRQTRIKHPRTYMQRVAVGLAIEAESEVPRSEVGFEFMMNTLRLTSGFAVPLFQERSGYPIDSVERELREAEAAGLIARDRLRIAPTERGQRFLNDLLQLFLRDH